MIDGILHRVRTGVQWRDLPEQYGPWKTVYERHRTWSADGTWEHLLQQVQAAADAAGGIDWDVSLHRRAGTPARRRARSAAPPAPKGDRSVELQGRDGMGGPARPAGGGGAAGEGLGRSRGGFTTKIHLSADGHCRPLSLLITAGTAAARLRKGSRCGRPPGFDKQRYTERNTIERAVNRLKQLRAVATRYDKRGYVYLGTATLAAAISWLRA